MGFGKLILISVNTMPLVAIPIAGLFSFLGHKITKKS